MIQVSELTKRFGSITAVNALSFSVEPGEILGLLGPNGAGKTTTLRMLYGLLQPSGGAIRVAGFDVRYEPLKVQQRMGVLPDNGGLYSRLTARENIRYFGELQGLSLRTIQERTEEFVHLLGMASIIDRPTKGFSQGERMKVSLARALVHDPEYLLLDEPTNGLDVLTTRAVRRLLQDLRQRGKCIIFSSHLMHEVGQLCDRVAIVAHGQMMALGKVSDVTKQADAENLEEAFVHFAYGQEAVDG